MLLRLQSCHRQWGREWAWPRAQQHLWGRAAAGPAAPWSLLTRGPLRKYIKVFTVPPPHLFLALVCFFALLGESISRGVSFVYLLRRDQVPSLEGRSLGSAVLLKTVGRVFADAGMPAEARAWAVGRAPFCTPSLLNE